MYCFSDYDDMLEKDCAIKGDAYTQIINVCFRYAVMFSLTTTKKHPAMVSEAPPPIFSQPHYNKGVSGGFRDTVYFFSCSEQAKTFLLSFTDDLFSWVDYEKPHRPEDLVFYREDGSVFFWSETHEGVCALINRENEDVSAVVSQPGWERSTLKSHSPIYGVPRELWFENLCAPSIPR